MMQSARTLQRMVHVGCKQLGIDDDTRRDLQLALTGKASLSAMDETELRAMVDDLKARGFKPGFKGGSKGSISRSLAPRADLRYIHILWKLLSESNAVKTPGREGLNAFVRSRFGKHWSSVPIDIDALRNADQINDVTRALKAMCRRAGVSLE